MLTKHNYIHNFILYEYVKKIMLSDIFWFFRQIFRISGGLQICYLCNEQKASKILPV